MIEKNNVNNGNKNNIINENNENNYKVCCKNCKFFEERTHFCRLNPPQPLIFPVKNKGNNIDLVYVAAKFPVINKPNIDFCSHFKLKFLLNE